MQVSTIAMIVADEAGFIDCPFRIQASQLIRKRQLNWIVLTVAGRSLCGSGSLIIGTTTGFSMNHWLDFDWQDWVAIDDLEEHPCAELGVGVYAVGAGLRNGNPVPIHRLCGCDHDGILFIGGGILALRIGYLLNVTDDAVSGLHASTSFIEEMKLDRVFDRKFLRLRWCEVDNSKAAEKQLITAYVDEFGELPPGNSMCLV